MYWENNRGSDQIEDLRNAPGGGLGGGRRRVGGRGIGLGTIAIALVAGWIFGINPMTIPRCRVPDHCLDSKRYPLFMAREVMAGVIEQLSASRSKPA
jgi:predicted metalloprotease